MRRLTAIAALTLMLGYGGGTSGAAVWPVCFSCSPSAAVAVKRDGVVLVRGGMGGGGGMHCGPSCGGGRGGMGGGAGGMSGSGGGMGGAAGGMGGGLGGWNPFMAFPGTNCPGHRRKSQCR